MLLASYNIRKAIAADRRRRPDRILGVLDEIGPEVALLQEADRRFGARQSALPFHLLAEHGGWRPVAFGVRDGSLGWHGNAILVAPHVRVLRCQSIHLPALEPRGAVLADLALGDTAVRVVGMHLDLSGLWRRRQVRAVLAELARQPTRLPVVAAGDLNEWTAAGGIRDFASHLRELPTGPSFHARRPIARLDRLLVGPEIAADGCGVHSSLLARAASDHLPVWARLRLPGLAKTAEPPHPGAGAAIAGAQERTA